MPWVDLFQHMRSLSGVVTTISGATPESSLWKNQSTLDPDVRNIFHVGYCGEVLQEYLPPDGDRGGVTFNNFDLWGNGWTSYNTERINAISPENENGFVLSAGDRIRVRARFVGEDSGESWSSEGAGEIGFVFMNTNGEGLHLKGEFANFDSMDKSQWTGWFEHTIESGDLVWGQFDEFQGVGHRTYSPESDGPPTGGLEVEWQIWVDNVIIANDDEATIQAGDQVVIPILANDTLNDEPVTLADLAGLPTITQQPESGSAEINENGELVYTPEPGFSGTVTLEYKIETAQCADVFLSDGPYYTQIDPLPSWMEPFSIYRGYISNSEDPSAGGAGVWYVEIEVDYYESAYEISNISYYGDVPYPPSHEDPPTLVDGFIVWQVDGGDDLAQCARITIETSPPA